MDMQVIANHVKMVSYQVHKPLGSRLPRRAKHSVEVFFTGSTFHSSPATTGGEYVMEPKLKEFYAKLKQGPAFLLLGQNYLRLETGVRSIPRRGFA